MAVHCPECGFLNAPDANFCQRCGSPLGAGGSGESVTATYMVDEATGELVPVELEQVIERGPALVVRAGEGHVGESFPIAGERVRIGRRRDSDVLLDDVTVSRDHALIIRRGDHWYVDDCGSLNGTYVNRARIESQRLEEGDELQIGKFKLTYHMR